MAYSVYSYSKIRHISEKSFVSLLGYNHIAQCSVSTLQPQNKYLWGEGIGFRTSEIVVSL